LADHGYNNVNATADHRLTSYPRSRQAFLEAFGTDQRGCTDVLPSA
jgi:hypothetical protein